MTLDLTSFEKAVSSLERAIAAMDASSTSEDADRHDLMRDGVIQRFEYTFELAWKHMRRYLRIYGFERVETLTNRELFRLAAEQGLSNDAEEWFDLLQARNRTSHVYDEDTAREVYEAAVASRPAFASLIENMQRPRI